MAPPVSKQMIRDCLTPDIQNELLSAVDKLVTMELRTERVSFYETFVRSVSQETSRVIDLIHQKEREHVIMANHVLLKIPGFMEGRQRHDYTKDELYFFVTSMKFDCQFQGDSLVQLSKMEIDRHFQLEAHHPQYEDFNNRECTERDIEEMAIDRLCRNIQFNGHIVDEEMARFIPEFPLGDNEEKQRMFKDFVQQRKQMVVEEYERMFGQEEDSLCIPPLQDKKQCHAFIAHSSADRELSETITEELEQYGLKCFHADRDFLVSEICSVK